MKELHLTKKDFKVEWFSGTGAGGQYRNKHQNCCRITHIQTGLRAQETGHRERPANQRSAFNKLAKMVIAHFMPDEPERRENRAVIRNYHAVRNIVKDRASGLTQPYSKVVISGDLSDMIAARLRSVSD